MFPLKTLECGNQPYIASDFAASYSYRKPGDGLYRGPDIFTQPDEYYCSEADVKAAGYRPYVWGDERCRNTGNGTHCASGGNGFTAMVPYMIGLIIMSVPISTVILYFLSKKGK